MVNKMRFVLASVLAFVVASAAVAAAAKNGLLAELRLDASGRYEALLHIGTPPQPKSLIFDISQNNVRLRCEKGAASTPTAPFDPHLSSTFCPASGHSHLVTDTFTFNSTNGKTAGEQDVAIKAVTFVCSPPLPASPAGVAGFGSGALSLPSIVAARQKLPRKFAYCLSGTTNTPTPLFLGASNYTFIQRPPLNDLLHTPLLKPSGGSGGYRVAVLALKVAEATVPLKPAVFSGGLEISTTEQYTKLVRPAYAALVKAFTAAESGIPRVSARAPFKICYNATGVSSTRVGPGVNPISFVLADNRTEWILYGENTMVFVSEEVMCLGFLDAGPLPAARSVLGTFQQQDSLVELDLDRNQLAFYSTLPFIEAVCADFNFSRGSF